MKFALFWGIAVVAAWACVEGRTVGSMMDGGDGGFRDAMQASMRRLLQDGSDSCSDVMDNTDLPSGETINNGRFTITPSNGDCCALCDKDPDCKAWTRIKWDTVNNKAGECWLRNHVPSKKSCSYCASGIKKSSDDILDECESSGGQAASFAFRGACSTLTLKCPPPKNDDFSTRSAGASARSYQDFLSESVTEARDRTCRILFVNNCIRSSFDKAIARGNLCSSILLEGPEEGIDTFKDSCPNFEAAVEIFEEEVRAVCDINTGD